MTSRMIAYKDGDQSLSGYFAPVGAGQTAPGVLIAHAWLGITDSIRSRADRIAAAGYNAFACDIFGHPVGIAGGPRPLVDPFRADRAMFRRRVRAGLETLAEQVEVDASHLAAIGYCFGGNAVLELARDGAPLLGVVSFHGELDTPLPARPGDITGKVLALCGDEDPVVPWEKIRSFRDEMRAAEVDFEIDVYAGAKHSFTGEGSLGPERTPEAVLNPQAEARSWGAMMAFFAEVLS
jgi:dienelactone hydrolase